ncbi:MAG: hypothetical protein ACRBCK_01370 [Alphaproteobacteria bacterium]
MSKGTWTDALGQKTNVDLTYPSDDMSSSVENSLSIPDTGSSLGMGRK